MYCSIHQALGIWDDLRDALEGKHHFGSDTAEIYAYRLMPNNPSETLKGEKDNDDILHAAKSLVELIEIFTQHHDGITVLIHDMKPQAWLKKYGKTFDWRVQVKVIKHKKKR